MQRSFATEDSSAAADQEMNSNHDDAVQPVADSVPSKASAVTTNANAFAQGIFLLVHFPTLVSFHLIAASRCTQRHSLISTARRRRSNTLLCIRLQVSKLTSLGLVALHRSHSYQHNLRATFRHMHRCLIFASDQPPLLHSQQTTHQLNSLHSVRRHYLISVHRSQVLVRLQANCSLECRHSHLPLIANLRTCQFYPLVR
jgi:hypothetical protein